jgi:hypothetical protein
MDRILDGRKPKPQKKATGAKTAERAILQALEDGPLKTPKLCEVAGYSTTSSYFARAKNNLLKFNRIKQTAGTFPEKEFSLVERAPAKKRNRYATKEAEAKIKAALLSGPLLPGELLTACDEMRGSGSHNRARKNLIDSGVMEKVCRADGKKVFRLVGQSNDVRS